MPEHKEDEDVLASAATEDEAVLMMIVMITGLVRVTVFWCYMKELSFCCLQICKCFMQCSVLSGVLPMVFTVCVNDTYILFVLQVVV